MNTWIDNLLALLIGGVVTLILVSQQRTAQDLSVDSTLSYMSKSQTLDMATWMTEDLNNLGSGVTGVLDVLEIPTYNSDSLTTRFAFQRRYSRTEAAQAGTPADTVNPKRFVYDLSQVSSVTVKGQTVKLYALKRCATASSGCSSSDPVVSSARMSDFRIETLDRTGARTSLPDSARLIRVRLATVLPMAESRNATYIPQTYWGTTLPVMQPDNR